jgi:anti-sigma B factor antagonist
VIGPTFKIEVFESDPRVRLAVHGEIDIMSAPELDDALSSTDSKTVVLDLSDVSFIDSSGLRVLVMARNRLDSQERSLVLCAGEDSAVVRTIRLAGLTADFEVVAKVDDLSE